MSALSFVPIAHNLHRVAFAGANMESIYNKKASTRKGKCLKEVGLLGFEPRKTGPESVVLPLHHSPNEKIAPSMGSTGF